VSHRNHIEVLEWNQPDDARSNRRITYEDGQELVRRLIAERISQKKIRLLPPNSVFRALAAPMPIPDPSKLGLPPIEPDGHTFYPPLSADWQAQHSYPTRQVQTVARIALSELKVSLREQYSETIGEAVTA
jgi:hypothetical protein